MRFISADVLFIGNGSSHSEGVVVLDENRIADVLPNRDSVSSENLEIHSGAISPGFVNTHCHLELSHLLGKIPHGTGLPMFLESVMKFRNEDDQVKVEAMASADNSMWESGIDVVGDISNTADSLSIKEKSNIFYHTFVEVTGIGESVADSRLEHSTSVQSQFEQAGLSASLVPHAPYSLSDKLRKMVINSGGAVSSIHNQECEAEDQYFTRGNGKLKATFEKVGLSMAALGVTGKSSIRSILPDFDSAQRLVLVHNSFTRKEDMSWANENWPNLFWCTCPSANIYIEYRVPKISEWLNNGAKVCLGTDSLASNDSLSMVQEMSLTQMRCPEIPASEILKMATANGAEALGLDSKFGLLEKGRSSGVILLSEITSELSRITDRTEVKRLV